MAVVEIIIFLTVDNFLLLKNYLVLTLSLQLTVHWVQAVSLCRYH